MDLVTAFLKEIKSFKLINNYCSCLVLITVRNMSQIMLIKSVYFPSTVIIDFKHCQCHYSGLTQQTVDALFFRKPTGLYELHILVLKNVASLFLYCRI